MFGSVIDDLSNGNYNVNNNYSSYLKMTFPAGEENIYPIVINSGFYDSRTSITSLTTGENWSIPMEIYNENGVKFFVFWHFSCTFLRLLECLRVFAVFVLRSLCLCAV